MIVEDNIILSIFCYFVIFLWVFEFVVFFIGGRWLVGFFLVGFLLVGFLLGVDLWFFIVFGLKYLWFFDFFGFDNNIFVGFICFILICEFGW